MGALRPAEHSVHDKAPALLWLLPSGQNVHFSAPAAEYCPTSHGVQEPSEELAVPAGHVLHPADPKPGCVFPAGQLVQTEFPFPAANFPAEHI